jgi:ABC-type multidrug transport system ATPase subunit
MTLCNNTIILYITILLNKLDEIETIRLQFGICPQDNILWDDLTAKEHLLFFARIKGLHGKELKESVKAWLEKVFNRKGIQ